MVRWFPASCIWRAGLPIHRSARAGGANEPDDGIVVGEDADDIGAALDLAVEPLERVCGVDFRPVRAGEVHIVSAAPAAKGTSASIARPITIEASAGLVANATVSGTWAWPASERDRLSIPSADTAPGR